MSALAPDTSACRNARDENRTERGVKDLSFRRFRILALPPASDIRFEVDLAPPRAMIFSIILNKVLVACSNVV